MVNGSCGFSRSLLVDCHGCWFLLLWLFLVTVAVMVISCCQLFPFSFGSGCRMGDNKKQMTTLMTMAMATYCDDMLCSIIIDRWHTCCFALSSSSLSAATAADDDDADSVIIHHCHHCYCNDNKAARVLKRCASKEGGTTINLCDGIVACHQWSFPQLHHGCCGHFYFVVVVGCQGCIVLFCSCVMVVAVALWLLQLCCSFPQLRHGCCGCTVVSCSCVVV